VIANCPNDTVDACGWIYSKKKKPKVVRATRPNALGCSAIRKAIFGIVLGICLLGVGCAAPTVWKAEVRSPDGSWIAIARTVQSGGYGTASIITSVSLKQANISQPPIEVLAFSCQGPVPRPYVLDNAANVGGTIGLTMKWVTPLHLDVTYDGHADLYFQAVKYAGIEISVRNLLSANVNPSGGWQAS
jgi:hypothetical protein